MFSPFDIVFIYCPYIKEYKPSISFSITQKQDICAISLTEVNIEL